MIKEISFVPPSHAWRGLQSELPNFDVDSGSTSP